MAVAGAAALIPGRAFEARGGSCPLGVAMATVLVAVLMLAGSIWIAIRMEAGLDTPAIRAVDQVRGLRACGLRGARMPVDHTCPVRPARCRLQPAATKHGARTTAPRPAATRPARCTDPSVIHGVPRPRVPVAYPERAGASAPGWAGYLIAGW